MRAQRYLICIQGALDTDVIVTAGVGQAKGIGHVQITVQDVLHFVGTGCDGEVTINIHVGRALNHQLAAQIEGRVVGQVSRAVNMNVRIVIAGGQRGAQRVERRVHIQINAAQDRGSPLARRRVHRRVVNIDVTDRGGDALGCRNRRVFNAHLTGAGGA